VGASQQRRLDSPLPPTGYSGNTTEPGKLDALQSTSTSMKVDMWTDASFDSCYCIDQGLCCNGVSGLQSLLHQSAPYAQDNAGGAKTSFVTMVSKVNCLCEPVCLMQHGPFSWKKLCAAGVNFAIGCAVSAAWLKVWISETRV
jgi:hypothetical protein